MKNLICWLLVLNPLVGLAQWVNPAQPDFSASDEVTICHWSTRSDSHAAVMRKAALDAATRRKIRCLSEEEKIAEAKDRERVETERRQLLARLNNPAIRSLVWRDRLDRVVQDELSRWLTLIPQGTDEVLPPPYPAALFLKQDVWETNKEFEDRVEAARTERRRTIERLEADYRAKVEQRNKRVADYNRTRQEREAGVAKRRQELITTALAILAPTVTMSDVALDQQLGVLTISTQIDGLGRQVFAFKDAPQAFRRSA
jgi:hypothetical protein